VLVPPGELIVKLVDLVETVTGVPVPLATPVPLKVTVCGEPLALSVIVRAPVRLPEAVGVNVTEMVQFAPAATELAQFCVSAKSPDALIEVMYSAAVPEFVSVIVCTTLVEVVICEAKVRVDGDNIIPGVGAIPMPLKPTVWGEPVALSAMVSEPV
jgi:hypothetical protein